MPNLRTASVLVDSATKCLATAASEPSASTSHLRAVAALVIVSSVVNVFDAMTNSVSPAIQIARRLGEVGAVDVGDEAERHRPFAERTQREIRHLRSEIGAADADVDDVADALAGMAEPRAGANARGEFGHRVQHLVHVRHDVMSIDQDTRVLAARAAPRAARHAVR